jgi:hypothetical protein
MSVLAAALIGAACALLAGALMGTLPDWRLSANRFAPRRARSRLWFQQAGAGLTPARFWAGSIAAGLLALLVLVALTGSVFVALVPAIAVALFPRGYFARRRRLRMREVQSAWPDGLRDIVASIAAGRSLTQAVNSLAATGPPALREAFARFPELARVLGTGPALELVEEELADPSKSNTHLHPAFGDPDLQARRTASYGSVIARRSEPMHSAQRTVPAMYSAPHDAHRRAAWGGSLRDSDRFPRYRGVGASPSTPSHVVVSTPLLRGRCRRALRGLNDSSSLRRRRIQVIPTTVPISAPTACSDAV